MTSSLRTIVLSGAVVAALAPRGGAAPRPGGFVASDGVRLQIVARNLDHPVYLTSPPGDARLFVVEQPGRIRIVENGRLLSRPFLDITDRVRSGGERGLLSVAFHPRYAHNGRFFVNYTDRHGHTRIERYSVTADPDLADPESGRLILMVPQPYSNHNGGLALFGPDGMLYVGMGDGGGAGDPRGNGQNPQSLLGKLLRLDVDGGNPYAIPADNPFVGRRDARPEIWALGLRNPWRFSIDSVSRLIYIADVGQNRWEEVDVAPAFRPGLNFGWNHMEGDQCYRDPRCDRRGLERPALVYSHADGCSITGGVVYRGRGVPALIGAYLFSDYCSGWIRSFRIADGRVTDRRQWRLPDRLAVTSFGVDSSGEVYVLSHDGRVLKLVPAR